MYNRRYDRKTIILKQETESFSRQGASTAVCVVEIKNGKGKVIIKGNVPEFYRLYLIANDEGGNIIYNAGEGHEVHFEADNVGQSGQRIENFDVFVVGGRREDGQFLSECYVGYAGKRREWRQKVKLGSEVERFETTEEPKKEAVEDKNAKNTVREKLNEETNEKVQEEAHEEVFEETCMEELNASSANDKLKELVREIPKEKIFAWGVGGSSEKGDDMAGDVENISGQAKESVTAPNENETKKEDFSDTFKNIVKNFNAQMKKLESMGVLSMSEVMDIKKEREEQETAERDSNEKESFDYEHEKYVFNEHEEHTLNGTNTGFVRKNFDAKDEKGSFEIDFGENINEIFENNPSMEPFEDSGFVWARICPEELWLLPKSTSAVNTSSFVICADRKYKHIMIGKNENSLLLAVPGIFGQKDKKAAEALGFMDFWKNKGTIENSPCYGYWIMKIN